MERSTATTLHQAPALSMQMAHCNGAAQTPHAVVFPWPGQGHLNPLLHLSKRLASDYGFSITFVNLEFSHRFVVGALEREESEKLAYSRLGIRFVSLGDAHSAATTRTASATELCKAVVESGAAFERLLSKLQPPATCIISDIFVLPTQDAANKLGIPRVAFWTQSSVSFSAHLLAARGLLQSANGEGTLIHNVAGATPFRVKDLPGFLQSRDKSDFMFDFSVRPFKRLEESACVLMNTFEAMEGETLRILAEQLPECRFFVVGPVLPPDYFHDRPKPSRTLAFWAEDFSCLHWLDEQQENSVVYVSFGSITELTQEELQELALGLEASGFQVLWVLRPGGVEGGGKPQLPAGFEERSRGQVLMVEWAPQLEVLAHASVGGFFTHAGWNSTLEGLVQGKPMLAFPYFADQMTNAKCIEDVWGNGMALERHGEGLLSRALVQTKVRALMEDPRFRGTALRLREGARQAVCSTRQASSTAHLSAFVDFLTGIFKVGPCHNRRDKVIA